MGSKPATAGASINDGGRPIHWEILREKVCILEWVIICKAFFGSLANHGGASGWAKYMEWMYPVEVRYTSKTTFKATGAVVAATL
jgi:hypothetical protein